MKRLLLVMVLAFSVIGVAAVSTDSAEAASDASCSLSAHTVSSPGISAVASLQTFRSDSGSASCTGVIFGTQVAGTGPLSISGTSLDSCASGEGTGLFRGSLPKVKGGNLKLEGTFRFERTGMTGTFTGTAEASNGEQAAVTGTFTFTPDPGQNCVVVPITGATVSGSARVFGQ